MQKLLLAGALLACSACTTAPVNTASNAAQAGRQYATTVKQLNQYALDESLGFTANLLPQLPRQTDVLQAQTDAMRQRVALVDSVAVQLDQLSRYFELLDAVASGDDSVATGKALGQLASGFKIASSSVGDGIGRLVANGHHSSQMAKVLQRDAALVSAALQAVQAQLNLEMDWTKANALANQKAYWESKIQGPYVEGKTLPVSWKNAWVNSLKTPDLELLLRDAQTATDHMVQAWYALLRGDQNASATFTLVQGELADVEKRLKKVKP